MTLEGDRDRLHNYLYYLRVFENDSFLLVFDSFFFTFMGVGDRNTASSFHNAKPSDESL